MTSDSYTLLRHAETNFHVEKRYQGRSPMSKLSDHGIAQTIELRECLKQLDIRYCFCSPTTRVRQTYEILAPAIPFARMSFIDALEEVTVPTWEGRLKAEIEEYDPNALALWRLHPHLFFSSGGDRPLLDLYGRVCTFLESIHDLQGGKLILGHDRVNRAAISALLDLPIELHASIPQASSSMSIVAGSNGPEQLALQVCNLEHDNGRAKPLRSESAVPRLILVRHGVTKGNEERVYQGTGDECLSSEGRSQIMAAGELLQGVQPTLVVSSGLCRAKESASLLPFARSVERLVDPRLNEFNYGRWQGKTDAEVDQRFPEDKIAWRLMVQDHPIPDGESLSSLFGRVAAFSSAIWERARPNSTVVVVAHDIVIRTIITLSLRLHLRKMWAFPISNGGVTELALNGWGPIALRKHNILAGRLEDRYGREYL